MDSNRNFPEELLLDIFTILPVKSLCRFKCVSKHWFSVISDPKFISTHLLHSTSRPKLLISVTKGWNFFKSSGDEMSFYSIDYPEGDEPGCLHATAHGSINSPSMGVISVSPVSGLILCNCYQGIRIGNPITGKFQLIKYPSTGSNKKCMRSYLGFDPIDDKNSPVILNLKNNYPHAIDKRSVFPLLESQWHDTPPHQPFTLAPNESGICMNGVVYFPVDEPDFTIGAFDVRSEYFELIQGPPDLEFFPQLIIEYKGRVALIGPEDSVNDFIYTTGVLKLWILEDPKKNSWSFKKSFVIPWGDENVRGHIVKPFGATHRGELMFATNLSSSKGSLDLFLFEIDTNNFRKFQVDGFGKTPLPRQVRLDFLIESLHSPKSIII